MIKLKELKAREVMGPATAATGKTTVKEALKLLKTGPGVISVVDDNKKFLGTVSERSLLKVMKHETSFPMSSAMWFDTLGEEVLNQHIGSIMNTRITTVKPEDDVLTAVKLMSTIRSRFMHVVERDGRLAGLIRVSTIIEMVHGKGKS